MVNVDLGSKKLLLNSHLPILFHSVWITQSDLLVATTKQLPNALVHKDMTVLHSRSQRHQHKPSKERVKAEGLVP
jgi:hypothetical protein